MAQTLDVIRWAGTFDGPRGSGGTVRLLVTGGEETGMAVGEALGSGALPTRLRAVARTPPRDLIISLGRRATLPLTILILAVTVWTWVEPWQQVVAVWGADYDFFRSVTDRWLATGAFYHPHQLAGPYEAAINVDTLYPPIALALFLPFVWLPPLLWWAIPLSIITWVVVRSRPAMWVWPFLAVMLWWPRTQSIIVWGNTGMWIAAFLALSTRFGWVSALIWLKPSLGPFALLGAGSRAWWVATAVIALVSLPMLPDYVAALRNNVGAFPGLDYSVQDIPFIAIPIIAWMARTEAPSAPSPAGSEGRP